MTRWTASDLVTDLRGFRLGPVDFELDAGRSLAVVGRSGAGKTTLLRALAGFAPLRAGRLSCDGIDRTRSPPEHRAIGYVPQGFGLFPDRTVAENVGYPLRVRGRSDPARVRALLDRFGLAPFAERRPHALSSGEAQKVAIARALASGPKLLLWDEPAHALDVEARDELVAIFREVAHGEGVPLVVVTHDPTLAFTIADRFLLLDTGRVLFHGDAHALVDRPPDRFTARFAGFENVLGRPELAAAGPGLAGWLLERAGADGVAFPSPFLGPASGSGRWEGEVRSVRPGPEGIGVDLAVGGLHVRGQTPWRTVAAGTTVGSIVRFDLAPGEVRALGGPAPLPAAA